MSALHDERDFLLRSLDDLEAERAAGAIDDETYATLHADYTARAAAVLRAIERGEEEVAVEGQRLRPPLQFFPARLALVAFEGKGGDIAGLAGWQAQHPPSERAAQASNTGVEIAIAAPEVDDQHAVVAEHSRAIAIKRQRGECRDLGLGVIAVDRKTHV